MTPHATLASFGAAETAILDTMAILFHGTTVGWLHLDRFRRTRRPTGECAEPYPFICLSHEVEGAEGAACKAYTAVMRKRSDRSLWPAEAAACRDLTFDDRARADGRLTDSDFRFNGRSYAVSRYVYRVDTLASVVLDLDMPPTAQQEEHVLEAIAIVRRHQGPLAAVRRFAARPRHAPRPMSSIERLRQLAGNDRGLLVNALAAAGVDIVRNIERDGDGQNHGHVYALPFSRADKVKILPPTVFMIHRYIP